MRYDGDVNYAADPYGYKPQRRQRRGLYTLGFAVVGIVAFAGAVIVTYGGGGSTVTEGGVPLLTADATPTKLRPEQPGGMEVLHQDKLVYERLNERGGGNRPTVERLLPPPEEPLPRPVVAPQLPGPPPLPDAPSVAQMPSPPLGATATVPREMPQEEAVPAPVQPAPQAEQPTPAPVAAPPPPVVKTPVPTPAPAPTPSTVAAAPPQPAKPLVAGGAGGWRVQLASVRSEAEAAAEWKRLSSRYPDALGGLSMAVARADLGQKGIYYRIQGVGLDEAKARAICTQLKAQSVGCVLVRP